MKTMRAMALLALMLLAAGVCSAEQADAAAAKGGPALIPTLETTVGKEDIADYDFTDRAMAYLAVIGERFQDRCVTSEGASEGHEAFVDWLLAELAACGYDPSQIEEMRFSGEDMDGETLEVRDIVVTLPGQAEGQIIVGAHFDGDGFADNGSGTALLLATAAELADVRPQYTIKFIFFDGEEENLVGSRQYARHMTDDEVASTIYMINMDALLFGDFCNLYGGIYGDEYESDYLILLDPESVPEPRQLEAYEFAAKLAEDLGFKVYRPEDLDGYYDANGHGMEPEDGAFFTNPWTVAHPAPQNMLAPSPAAFSASDHAAFAGRGIPYVYFEAANWWAAGDGSYYAYTSYFETYDDTLGRSGQFMNTEYDRPEVLERLFPGRAEQHLRQYSPLLSALLLVKAAE